jgi:hypothetical protein
MREWDSPPYALGTGGARVTKADSRARTTPQDDNKPTGTPDSVLGIPLSGRERMWMHLGRDDVTGAGT